MTQQGSVNFMTPWGSITCSYGSLGLNNLSGSPRENGELSWAVALEDSREEREGIAEVNPRSLLVSQQMQPHLKGRESLFNI